jgi:hypothetical protein
VNATLKRALHTFWQAALGSLIVVWASSGFDVKDLTNVSGIEKVVVALVVGAVSAGLSAVYHQFIGDLEPKPAPAPVTPTTVTNYGAGLQLGDTNGGISTPPAPEHEPTAQEITNDLPEGNST